MGKKVSDYEFEMPWPPSINTYRACVRNRLVTSKKGRDYMANFVARCIDIGIYGEMIEGDIAMSITLNPPTLRRYDIDNFNKAVFDSLTKAKFWHDDEQVTSLIIQKGEKTKDGNVMMKICCDNNKRK